MRRPLLLPLLVAGLPLAAQGPAAPGDVEDLRSLQATRVRLASGHDQALLRSPQAVEVLEGETLRSLGIHRLTDALRLMSSVEVIEVGGVATAVSLRGMFPDGVGQLVQILVDGVPIQNSSRIYPLDLDLLPIPLELVDRIEVVRGPSASLHGANAVGGVVALTTRQPNGTFEGGLRAQGGSRHTARGEAALLGRVGTLAWSGGLGQEHTGDSGHRPYHVLGGSDVPTFTPSHDGFRLGRATAGLRWTPPGGWSAWASAGRAERWNGPDLATAFGLLVDHQRFTATLAQAGLAWRSPAGLEVALRLARTEDVLRSGAQPGLAGLDPGFLDPEHAWAEFTHHLVDLRATVPLGGTTWVVGGDQRRLDTPPIPAMGLGATHLAFRGVFLHATVPLNADLALSLGVRRETGDLGGADTSPRAALVWEVSPGATLRLGWSTASRSPTLSEALTSNPLVGVLPSPDLQRERISGWEAGWRGEADPFTWDVTAYVMRYREAISFVLVGPGLRQYVNRGEGWNRGLELAGTWRPGEGWSTGAGLDWNHFALEGMGHRTTYAPRLRAHGWVRWRKGSWSTALTGWHVGATPVNTFLISGPGGLGTEERPALSQVSLRVGWELRTGLTLEAYGRDLARDTTPQGAGGPATTQFFRFARRELGLGLAWRW